MQTVTNSVWIIIIILLLCSTSIVVETKLHVMAHVTVQKLTFRGVYKGGGGGGGITPIGAVYRAATGVKIFDRRKMALTA